MTAPDQDRIKLAYIAGHMRRALYASTTTERFSDRYFDAKEDFDDWSRPRPTDTASKEKD